MEKYTKVTVVIVLCVLAVSAGSIVDTKFQKPVISVSSSVFEGGKENDDIQRWKSYVT